VRAAEPRDHAALAALFTELGFPASPEQVAARWPRYDGDDAALVAELDGRVAGVITLHAWPVLHRDLPEGRITTLVVAEAARGRGVGRALVEAAERELFSRGCGRIEVTSALRLAPAHEFYLHLGYEVRAKRFLKTRVAT
jgi:GNAT superfamily N-acetyltransferase